MTDCPIHSAAKTTLGSVALAAPAICAVVLLSGREVCFEALLDTIVAAMICIPIVFLANIALEFNCFIGRRGCECWRTSDTPRLQECQREPRVSSRSSE